MRSSTGRAAFDLQERYHTRAEAIAGHTRTVDWLLGLLN